MENTD